MFLILHHISIHFFVQLHGCCKVRFHTKGRGKYKQRLAIILPKELNAAHDLAPFAACCAPWSSFSSSLHSFHVPRLFPECLPISGHPTYPSILHQLEAVSGIHCPNTPLVFSIVSCWFSKLSCRARKMHRIPHGMKDKYRRPTSGLNYSAWDPHNFLRWNTLGNSSLDA